MRESAFRSTSDRSGSRSETPAGSSTASNTAFSLMGKCRATRRWAAAAACSTPSSARPTPGSTCLAPSSWIWSPPSSTRSGPAPTASCSCNIR